MSGKFKRELGPFRLIKITDIILDKINKFDSIYNTIEVSISMIWDKQRNNQKVIQIFTNEKEGQKFNRLQEKRKEKR